MWAIVIWRWATSISNEAPPLVLKAGEGERRDCIRSEAAAGCWLCSSAGQAGLTG